MREIRSYGSVGEQGSNELLYPEHRQLTIPPTVASKARKTRSTEKSYLDLILYF